MTATTVKDNVNNKQNEKNNNQKEKICFRKTQMMSLSILIDYRKIIVCFRQLAVASTTRIDDKKRSLKLPQTSNANSTVARHIP